MQFFRKERVESLIQKELGEMLRRDFNFESVLVTITSTEVNKKLDNAKVGISTIPSEKGAAVLKKLKSAEKNINWHLLRKINIKPMPHVSFFYDFGPENSSAVEKALIGK
ncbi:MAG: hypothetical protein A2430_02925 [Candidatus Liptonbacteria bacterium RIFOXYC1_FULL_36_8]|uniref:Ribosome-binding factor A n=2 Tax=Candidatus Liptoniibacteriota TaxID=1817909 RepID=A0A1G2CQ92_9BACT|nr:MAG: hypothetical protein A2604_02565 [Candidatus Liptonbacteria bacterium RIFOXYD1_FULL_36_11]OGZ03352.1 MAG: hypothetical protein A2430_02925 [Candidatus Liptonbacteria bacterium RIFOXYC1_FULL_36_8]